MDHDAPMFVADEADPDLTAIINRLRAEGKQEGEIEQHVQAVLPELTAKAAAGLLAKLKDGTDAMFADRRHSRSGFLKRQREKWGKPLDLLFMLMEAAREAGEDYNQAFEGKAAADQDFVFDALRHLHARACLVASEVHWLMEGGFASGAMARWRTLHEITVVACFLRGKGQEVAKRYLLHHVVDTYKAAEDYQKRHQEFDYEPMPAEDLARLQSQCDTLCQRYGKTYKEQWGWAADALKPRPPNFAEIEAAVSFDRQRPFYKLACHSTHAGSKGIHFDLGNALNPPDSDILLAGPSDAGLFDPGACTANSLLHITTTLLFYRNEKLAVLFVVEALDLLRDEIIEGFAEAEAELAANTEAMRRLSQPHTG